MTHPRKSEHDMLAHIAALLLLLAILAERAAAHAAARLCVLSVLLPAHRAALTLLDVPKDDLDLSSPAYVPVPFRMDDRTCQSLLLQLSVGFRLIAAMLLHACLAESRPSSPAMLCASARFGVASVGLAPCPVLRGAGFVHDTS